MTAHVPPLEARVAVLRAWESPGTPSDVLRRLQGARGRATVRSVQRWAEMHGHLWRQPPRGLVLSSAGRRWLSSCDGGTDPDPPPQQYERPADPKPRKMSGPRKIREGSIPFDVLQYLTRNGSDCVSEIADEIGRKRRRVANSCRMLHVVGYALARPERRTIDSPNGPRPASVLCYTITSAGRDALRRASCATRVG